jgi:4-alpha-glucanotransferase
MDFQRSSGVLLHVSSLPSYSGIGDLGPAAYDFLGFLSEAKQHVWQVLPLCPTGFGNSPYAGSSAFAGNPYFISLEFLSDWGWIDGDRIAGLAGRGGPVNFEEIEQRKLPLLYEAAGRFLDRGALDARFAEQWKLFGEFGRAEANWLDDYAMYAVLRRQYKTGAWTEWPEPIRKRVPETVSETRKKHARAIALEQVLQFAFDRQWSDLRQAAARAGIRILGDIAIFVNFDSSDVWTHPDLFDLDRELRPVHVAGVPPDYFSATGQRWGNPLYRWDVLRTQGFDWWVQRIARSCQLYDIVRLDHFRGFESYWSIPADEETAINGQWIKAPGLELFRTLEATLGPLPLVAEDLGMITKAVDQLRIDLGMPGMRVIQFGFSDKGAHLHLPHRYEANTVAYTGTHDNDTTLGWWRQSADQVRAAAETYVGAIPAHDGVSNPVWPLMRATAASVAQLAIVPAQDLFELGSEARMNTPSVAQGNWSWRAPEGAWTAGLAARLAALADVTDRDNDPLAKPEEATEEAET